MWRGDDRPGVSVVRLFRLAVPEQLDRNPVSTHPIEHGGQISRTTLSDKTSRLHPRLAAAKLCQAPEPEVLVELREGIWS